MIDASVMGVHGASIAEHWYFYGAPNIARTETAPRESKCEFSHPMRSEYRGLQRSNLIVIEADKALIDGRRAG